LLHNLGYNVTTTAHRLKEFNYGPNVKRKNMTS